MLRVCIRALSQYKSPQQYNEFISNFKDANTISPEPPIDSLNRNSLTFRKVEIEDYDFYTATSDFDVERFNLREYVWSVIFYRDKTFMRLVLCLLSWTFILLFSKGIYMLFARSAKKLSPVGYFGLTQVAFKDMELERYKQRIKFSELDK